MEGLITNVYNVNTNFVSIIGFPQRLFIILIEQFAIEWFLIPIIIHQHDDPLKHRSRYLETILATKISIFSLYLS